METTEMQSISVPKNIEEFRTLLAHAAQAAKAPEDMVQEIADLEDDNSLTHVLSDAWHNIELELRDEPEVSYQWSLMAYYVHDAMIAIVSEFENAWNYAPGTRGQKPIDKKTLARRTEKAFMEMCPE
jgi:hypothetical protein